MLEEKHNQFFCWLLYVQYFAVAINIITGYFLLFKDEMWFWTIQGLTNRYLSSFSLVLWKRIPCILHMQIWWQRYLTLLLGFTEMYAVQQRFAGLTDFVFLFQSCAEGEEAEEEEGKEKTFEVLLISRRMLFYNPLWIWIIFRSGAFCIIISHRKRKWRNRRCCISKPGFMIVALQRWCSRWSVPAKV